MPSKASTEGCQPRIVRPREARAFRVRDHRPDLENRDDPAALANAAGTVKGRSAITRQPGRHEQACQDRAGDGETQRSQDKVKQALGVHSVSCPAGVSWRDP
jgi:hypothetical protein